MRRWVWGLVAVLASACGGGTPAPADGSTCDPEACDDGQFCNGAETCGADGCVEGAPPCRSGEACDEATDQCGGGCLDDGDGDGRISLACGGDDCDDEDERVHPGRTEVCDLDGLDEDCDPTTVAGPADDADDDGFDSDRCCNGATCGDDCDDALSNVNPDTSEVCNGRDDDCDGTIDEGVRLTFYRDVDGDFYGVDSDTTEACGRPEGYALMGGDCADTSPAVNPAASESCSTSFDDDCDGVENEMCDCDPSAEPRRCGPEPMGRCRSGTQACIGGRWESACAGAVTPEAETCNFVDDDCDGRTDEGTIRNFFRDDDRDGFGAPGTGVAACSAPTGHVTSDTDCNDGAGAINPAAAELCDGIDNNCDDLIDNSMECTCLPTDPTRSCGTSNVGLCRLGTARCMSGRWVCTGAIEPTTEVCNSGDDDCDGRTDEFVGTQQWRDADGDGRGGVISTRACTVLTGYVTSGYADCDDSDPLIFVGGVQRCNGRDGDCDGAFGWDPAFGEGDGDRGIRDREDADTFCDSLPGVVGTNFCRALPILGTCPIGRELRDGRCWGCVIGCGGNPSPQDCDFDPRNGCEQSLGTNAHCGACNAVCPPGATCSLSGGSYFCLN
jgi:hypothetical protein